MSRKPSTQANPELVETFVNSAFDTVKLVADSLDVIEAVAGNIVNSLKYLGASSTNPTVRLDGSPIESGDYYLNTIDNTLIYYNAAQGTWLSVDPTELLTARDETLVAAAEANASKLAAKASETLAGTAATTATTKAFEATEAATVAVVAKEVALNSKALAEEASATAVTKASEANVSMLAAEAARQTSVSASSIATTQAGIATTQAGIANASAANANASKLAAKGSEDSAKTSSDLAEAWASNPEDVVVADAKYSSFHYAEKAAEGADIATAKAAEATNSKNLADTAANTATTQAGIASAAAVSATASKDAASVSATLASTKADTATTKAGEAVISATTADAAKVAAAASAVSASASADRAEVAAGAAAGGMLDGGGCNLSGGVYPPPIAIGGSVRSAIWQVTTGGTVSGIIYDAGDALMYSEVLGTYHKIDNTFVALVRSVQGLTGDVVLTPALVGALPVGGVANTALKWETARTITLGGMASGAVSIDGSTPVTLEVDIVTATDTVIGVVRLNSSVSSTSVSEAATPLAVKAAYDKAYSKVEADARYAAVSHTHAISEVAELTTALDSKLPKTGGNITGSLTIGTEPVWTESFVGALAAKPEIVGGDSFLVKDVVTGEFRLVLRSSLVTETPEASATTFEYVSGTLVLMTETLPLGARVTSYTYTKGNLTEAMETYNGATHTTTYTYDINGVLTGVTRT